MLAAEHLVPQFCSHHLQEKIIKVLRIVLCLTKERDS